MSAMNTTLTLKKRSFYFNGDIQLIKNRPVEVDISKLNPNQLKTLKMAVDSGIIDSTMELNCVETQFSCEVSDKTEEESDEEEEESVRTEGPSLMVSSEDPGLKEEFVEEYDEEEHRRLYNTMNVSELKKEIKERSIETDKTRKSDLVDVLVENDKE